MSENRWGGSAVQRNINCAGGQPKPRLLVVPHIFANDIRVREIELARRLTRWFDVYCLAWKDALHVDLSSPVRRRWVQFRNSLHSLVSRRTIKQEPDGISYVTAPMLQPVLLNRLLGARRACAAAQAFNSPSLAKTIRCLRISHVLLACGAFRPPRVFGVKVFHDFVDWILTETVPGGLGWHSESICRIGEEASAVFAASEPLAEMFRSSFGLKAIPLPNGADVERLRSVPEAEVEAVRRRWGLTGKLVLGYIGNHGSFSGLDFALRAFQEVRKRIPNAALFVVGPCDYWKQVANDFSEDGVIFTGPVAPREIDAYFHALDVGILAQPKTPGSDYAFQLKVVEYSACRKFVVSTPLLVWERIGWPNVMLIEASPVEWADAIVKLRDARWSPEWDHLIDQYGWVAVAERAAGVMLGDVP